jgi:hypothetical protein
MRQRGETIALLLSTLASTAGGAKHRPTTRALPAALACGWYRVPAAPSVAAKPRLVARFATLSALVEVENSVAILSLRLRIGGPSRS